MDVGAESKRPNAVLTRLLAEAVWSPRAFARKINAAMGAEVVTATAPYHWRDAARVPRAPIPTVAATLLSTEVGRPVAVDELWGGTVVGSPGVIPADTGMDRPWNRGGTLGVIDDWVVSGLLDRRRFLAVSGVSLTSVAGGYLAAAPPGGVPLLGQSAEGPLIEQVERGIPYLQTARR